MLLTNNLHTTHHAEQSCQSVVSSKVCTAGSPFTEQSCQSVVSGKICTAGSPFTEQGCQSVVSGKVCAAGSPFTEQSCLSVVSGKVCTAGRAALLQFHLHVGSRLTCDLVWSMNCVVHVVNLSSWAQLAVLLELSRWACRTKHCGKCYSKSSYSFIN